ncbi:hypothetical protein ACEPPN_001723 [Leptodophora sp. 'Broadleaf-Isolate-01']
MSTNRALDFRWLGPYEIYKAYAEKGNKLKLFHKRQDFIYGDSDDDGELDKELDNNLTPNHEPDIDMHDLSDPKFLENSEIPTIQRVRDDGIVIRVPELSRQQRSEYRVVSDSE